MTIPKPATLAEIDFNDHPSFCYLNKNYLILSYYLIDVAVEVFNSSYRVKNFEGYLQFIKAPKDKKDFQKEFLSEHLIDVIRITTAYENYFKAVLLMQGFVIHHLNNNKTYKSVKEKAGKENRLPLLSEVRKIADFKLINSTDRCETLPGIANKPVKTYSMSALLKLNHLIKLPIEVLQTISEYNDYRNNLHLLIVQRASLNETTFNCLSNLIKHFEYANILKEEILTEANKAGHSSNGIRQWYEYDKNEAHVNKYKVL